MHYLTQIIEPKRLLFTWQAIDAKLDKRVYGGTRYIVGELLRKKNQEIVLKYYDDTPDFVKAQKMGFQGYPAFDINKKQHRNVFDIFARRIPPRSRSDFGEYLKYFGIDPNVEISDFALLGYSGAELPSDGFSLVHTFENSKPPLEIMIEIAGFRYYEGMNKINHSNFIGSKVEIFADPNNKYDVDAVTLMHEGSKIGHIKRGQTKVFKKWLKFNILEAYIGRIGGNFERPNVLLYVKVSS